MCVRSRPGSVAARAFGGMAVFGLTLAMLGASRARGVANGLAIECVLAHRASTTLSLSRPITVRLHRRDHKVGLVAGAFRFRARLWIRQREVTAFSTTVSNRNGNAPETRTLFQFMGRRPVINTW
jgi:hypothetical protein